MLAEYICIEHVKKMRIRQLILQIRFDYFMYLHGDTVLGEADLDLLDGDNGVVDGVPRLVHRPIRT